MDIPFQHKFTKHYEECKIEGSITGYCYEPNLCVGHTCPIFFRIDNYGGSVENEYEILSKLQEYDFVPKIISLSNIGSHKVLFTECIDGVSLDEIDVNNPRWKKGISGALDILYKLYIEKGFLHEDLCPSNIMIDNNDKIYIIDFEGSSTNTSDTWIFDLMAFVECVSYHVFELELIALYDELIKLRITRSTDADLYKEYITKFKNILFSEDQ